MRWGRKGRGGAGEGGRSLPVVEGAPGIAAGFVPADRRRVVHELFDQIGAGANAILHVFVAAGVGRQVQQEVLADDLGEVETLLIRLAVDLRTPGGEVGVVVEILEAGDTLELERTVKMAAQGHHLVKGIEVRRIGDIAGRTDRILRSQVENRGGQGPFEVQAFLGDVGVEHFHFA